MSNEPLDALERTQELFDFLQGTAPDGYRIAKNRVPKLTPEQAWTVVWFVQEMHAELPDHIERCDVCGDLYDSWSEGSVLDYGKAPYYFCDCCENGEVARKKRKRHPDKNLREP